MCWSNWICVEITTRRVRISKKNFEKLSFTLKYRRSNNEKLGELVDVSGILETLNGKPNYKNERDSAIRKLNDIIKSECSFRIAICYLTRDADIQTSILESLFRGILNLKNSIGKKLFSMIFY